MKKHLVFNWYYFILVLVLFAVELFIGIYVHDTIIRPYGGDFLVVMLIYCFIKTFFNFKDLPTAIGVLIFSFIIEALQYVHIVDKLSLQGSKFARIIIGTSFSWTDTLSYTCGIAVVIVLEIWLGAK